MLIALTVWRGSIYKLVWVDLLFFLILYYIISVSYRFLPDGEAKWSFEKVIQYCDKYLNLVPLSFILGFYVSLVMTRWWNQWCSIPFPDNAAIIIGASIKGQDEKAKIVRRTIVRYICATFTITLTMLSPKVKKRFPTLDHFIGAGLLTRNEVKIFTDLDSEFPSYSKYWLPLAWAANIVTRGRHEGFIRDDVSVKTILEELNRFRSKCGGMLDYDWISIPLVYTQVVTLVVYLYFIVSAIGRQYIDAKGTEDIDLYFPFFLVIEFVFYMGWLKVAEVLINPYGDDDDDFEVVWMVDRHLQVCYLLVDKIHQEHPKLTKDIHWSETAPNCLPFTVASKDYMQEYPFPSTLNVTVRKSEQDLVVPVEDSFSQVCSLQLGRSTHPRPDGVRQRSGAYLWRLYGRLHSHNSGTSNIPLTRVVSFDAQDIDDATDDVNYFDDNDEVVQKPCVTPCEEFERLKQSRMDERHKKILNFMELAKKEKVELKITDIIN